MSNSAIKNARNSRIDVNMRGRKQRIRIITKAKKQKRGVSEGLKDSYKCSLT